MSINVVNNATFKKISIVCGNSEYNLSKGEACVINEFSADTELKIRIGEKSKVHFNFFFFLLDGFIDDENFIFDLKADAVYEILLNNSSCTLYLEDLTARDDSNNMLYNAVYLHSNDVIIKNLYYNLTNLKIIKIKYWFIYLMLWAPALIFALVSLTFDTFVAIAFFVLIFFLFAIFTVRKASRFKKAFNNQSAAAFLYKKDAEYRLNNNREGVYEPQGAFEKGVFKVLDKVFKINSDKK